MQLKLWDKDYNLLWSGEKLPEFITVEIADETWLSQLVVSQGENNED